MAERRYPFRFRIGNRDPVEFDVQWKRDEALDFQLLAWDTRRVGDVQGLVQVGAITATVRAAPNVGASALLTRQCSGPTGHEGAYELVTLATDFASLTFEPGQPYRCLWLDLQAAVTYLGSNFVTAVFDGAGKSIFPLRVHQTMGVGA